MRFRYCIVLGLVLGLLALGWLKWRESSRPQLTERPVPTINKQPIAFANRTFDPAAPPADMPPLAKGEGAECDSHFLSNASVNGETRQTDATHGTLTITQVTMTLQLNITIWVPNGATQRVIEHEDGHRQISEYYYQSADKLAERIAASYMGKQVEVSGGDFNAASSTMLQQLATEITNEYDKGLNPEAAQLFYDTLTDHSRNEIAVQDAIATSLRDVRIAPIQPAANPGT